MTDIPAGRTVGAEPASDRQARLRRGVARLASSVTQADTDRWLLAAGPFLLPLGLFLIWLGWYGASSTSRVYLQIPYMISGGLTGLALVFAGGFLFFSRWMLDLLHETRRRSELAEQSAARTLAALERIESLLAQQGAAGMATRAGGSATLLVRTPKGSMAHRPDCSMVAGRSVVPVGGGESLSACRICQPDSD